MGTSKCHHAEARWTGLDLAKDGVAECRKIGHTTRNRPPITSSVIELPPDGDDFLTLGRSSGLNVSVKGILPPPKYSTRPKAIVSPPTAASIQSQKYPHAVTMAGRTDSVLRASTTASMT